MSQNIFSRHFDYSLYKVSKLLVTCTAFCLFGLSCYGITKLEQRFDDDGDDDDDDDHQA